MLRIATILYAATVMIGIAAIQFSMMVAYHILLLLGCGEWITRLKNAFKWLQ